jgi:hypothetical protein
MHRETLRAGSVLVDPNDPGKEPRVLFFLEQDIRDARAAQSGDKRPWSRGNAGVISREVHFVEIDEEGNARSGGYAPYLDYRPATADEVAALDGLLEGSWLRGDGLEGQAVTYAVEHLVPDHLGRVRERREELIDKTLAAVHERLTVEINYWDRRAAELRQSEKGGRVATGLNAELAQRRADELAARLEKRTAELALERGISASPPVVVGGALVVPLGATLSDVEALELQNRRRTELVAMQAVMEAERALGMAPQDVSRENRGYDIESRDHESGRLRFIEVKGYRQGATAVTVTRNEILTGINSAEQYLLALVEVADGEGQATCYVRRPFAREPDFGVTSVNYDVGELLARGVPAPQ